MFDFKADTEFDIIGMGEVMLRLSSPARETLSRSSSFIKNAGGSELNVVSGVSMLGGRGGLITKLPESKLGTYIRNKIRSGNVSDDFVIYDESEQKRLGIYYYECGAYPRKSSVIYDRELSSMNSLKLSEINKNVFSSAKVFHVSGITMGLSNKMALLTYEVIKCFKENGAKISFDVNYRESLWSEESARRTIEGILPFVDFLFVSEETSRRMFGKTGELKSIMSEYCKSYGCSLVASTIRHVVSPTKHNFSSAIYCENKLYMTNPYEGIDIIDRIGSGDAYVAGVLYGLIIENDIQKALQYGNALSALKNTVSGDMAGFSLDEVDSVIKAHNSNGIKSEMER